jgi:hypothetical protein
VWTKIVLPLQFEEKLLAEAVTLWLTQKRRRCMSANYNNDPNKPNVKQPQSALEARRQKSASRHAQSSFANMAATAEPIGLPTAIVVNSAGAPWYLAWCRKDIACSDRKHTTLGFQRDSIAFFYHALKQHARQVRSRRNRLVCFRMAQIAAARTANRLYVQQLANSTTPEEKSIEAEAQFHSRAVGDALDQTISQVGMGMRLPAQTRSGRFVYQLVTNEALLAEERQMLQAANTSKRKEAPASEPAGTAKKAKTVTQVQTRVFGAKAPTPKSKPKPRAKAKPKPKAKAKPKPKAKVSKTKAKAKDRSKG